MKWLAWLLTALTVGLLLAGTWVSGSLSVSEKLVMTAFITGTPALIIACVAGEL